MARIVARDLHFAAYLKANGAQFQGLESGLFVFESQRPEKEWRVAHSNSCCRRVDLELIDLRKQLREHRNS